MALEVGREASFGDERSTALSIPSPPPPRAPSIRSRTRNGHHLVWLFDGKGLSYRVGPTQQIVVRVTKPSFSIGNPTPVIARRLLTLVSTGSRSYRITPDGAFLTVTAASGSQLGSAETREIQIVLNWEEVKRLMRTT